jgi:hypothetical protein
MNTRQNLQVLIFISTCEHFRKLPFSSGKTGLFELELAGAGTIDAKSLVSEKAEVEISGAGTAEVSVTEELFADIDGVGTLTYYGDPVLKNISGGLTDIEQASKNVYGGT